MLESILTSNTNENITLLSMIISLIISTILGGIISFTYFKANKEYVAKSYGMTLFILPIIVSIIILLIGSNIARAFSLAGAFSIIRFRSSPSNPKDVAYVLFAMAAGLGSGMGLALYSIIFTIFLCTIMFISSKYFSKDDNNTMILKITIPEDLNYVGIFDDIFDNFTLISELVLIKTTNLGSMFSLKYRVKLKDNISTKTMIDEIRIRNGNLNISLYKDFENEE
jgi:hypothetical protein